MRKKLLGLFVFTITITYLTMISSAATEPTVRKQTVEESILYPGVNHIHSTITVTNDQNRTTPQNVNVVTKQVESQMVEVVPWAMFTNSGAWTLGTVKDIALDFEQKHPGYRVIAGVNGDYFAYNPSRSINMMVTQQGDVINPVNNVKYFSVGFSSSGERLTILKDIKYDDYFLTVYDANGLIVYSKWLSGANLTSLREGETAVYYDEQLDLPHATKFIVSQPERLTKLGGQLFARGRIDQVSNEDGINVSNPSVIIATRNEELKSILNQYPDVRIQKMPRWNQLNIDHVIGVDSHILRDGTIPSFDEIGGQSYKNTTDRHPRTSFGITENGDFIIATVDGRQSTGKAGVVSYGVDLRELAAIMKSFGAVEAFNIDGGGSTQMVVREGDELVIINSPSEGPHLDEDESYRRVANALLFVVPDVHVETAFTNPTATSIDIAYQISTATDVTITTIEAIMRDETISLSETTGNFSLNDLSYDELSPFNVRVAYVKDGKPYTKVVKSKVINLRFGAGIREPLLPSDFDVNFTLLEDKRLQILIRFTDIDRMLSQIVIRNETDSKTYIAVEVEPGLHALVIENIEEGIKYQFTIGYFVKDSVMIQPLEGNFTFVYEDQDENGSEEQNKNWILLVILAIGLGVSVTGLVILIFEKNRNRDG